MVMPGQNPTQTLAGTSALLEYMRLNPYLDSTQALSMCPQQRYSAHIRTSAAADQESSNPCTEAGLERCSSLLEMTNTHAHAVVDGTYMDTGCQFALLLLLSPPPKVL